MEICSWFFNFSINFLFTFTTCFVTGGSNYYLKSIRRQKFLINRFISVVGIKCFCYEDFVGKTKTKLKRNKNVKKLSKTKLVWKNKNDLIGFISRWLSNNYWRKIVNFLSRLTHNNSIIKRQPSQQHTQDITINNCILTSYSQCFTVSHRNSGSRELIRVKDPDSASCCICYTQFCRDCRVSVEIQLMSRSKRRCSMRLLREHL